MDKYGFSEINTENHEEEKRNYKGLKIYVGIGFAVTAAVVATGMLLAAKPEVMLLEVKPTGQIPDACP